MTLHCQSAMHLLHVFKSDTMLRSMSPILVYFLLILTLTSSQVAKVPFDDHYFEVKQLVDTSPPPPRVFDPYEQQRILIEQQQQQQQQQRYGSQNVQQSVSTGPGGSTSQIQLPIQYYSNGTHTLYQHGNTTELYLQNPDALGGAKGPIYIDPNVARKYVKSPLGTGSGDFQPMDPVYGANPNVAGYSNQSVGTGRSIPATGGNQPNYVEQTQRHQDQLARLQDVPPVPRYRGGTNFGTFGSQNYVSNVGPSSNIGDPSGPYTGHRYPGSDPGTEKDPLGAGRFPFGSDPVRIQPDKDFERPIIGGGGTQGTGGQQPNTGTGGGAGAGNIGYYNPGGIYVDPRQQPGSGRYDSRGVFDPGLPNQNFWNERWSTTTYRPMAPGVLGRWRDELQGKQRPEDINVVPTPVYTTTSYGRVQGFKVKLYDGPFVEVPARPGIAKVDKVKATVHSFVGIPYARAPINEGRFRPPRTHPGWVLHQAVEFGPACPQPLRYFGYQDGIVQVDEDCLYLNVFSPDVGSGAEGAPYPVIFYIHDGDFIHGGSQTFPPHQLVGWYKLVVVTVNFRLGSLGFLSTADEFSPGNYGMLDLATALKWVHTNIRSFNGDPNRINLLGLGSGAAAAGLLMLSPRTRDLVHNVIALEGAPTADWAAIWDRYRLQNTTELYALKMGCWHEYDHTSWTMVQCLRSRSWQELANLELDPDVGYFPWSPVVDREFTVPHDDFQHDWKETDWRFLPDTPENLLRASNYPSTIKYMTGYSRQCAADLLYANKTLAPNFIVTRAWFDEQINLWIRKYNYTLNPEGVFHAIRYAYTYWPNPTNLTHMREMYIDFLSDALYGAAIDQTTKLLLARGTQVHTMVVNYTLEGLRLPHWRETSREEQYYLLTGAPFMDPEFMPERLRVDRSVWTEGDRNMSLFMLTSIANFAHLGHPTSSQILGIFWERSTPADLKYLALNGTNNSTMDRNYRQRELTFWTEYMPFVVGKYVPTWPPTTEYWWEANQPIQVAFWSVSGICLVLLVILIICCLLWRTTKRQRDRIYDDLGLNSHGHATPLVLGHLVGGGEDMTSEYAETIKTIDSMDSGVKLRQDPRMTPSPSPMQLQTHVFPHPAAIHTNIGAISQPTISSTAHPLHPHPRDRDRYPIPNKKAVKDRERQMSAHTLV